MIARFHQQNFTRLCRSLGKKNPDLQKIIDQHGFPPLWNRKPSFETLLHIILEQQVSLASAKAALEKLRERITAITPQNVLLLTDAEMKACYFSRQKTIYARHLAEAVLNGFSIEALADADDDTVRHSLIQLKGIGNWTADVFLMMCLQRTDCFPIGDIALVNSVRKVKNLEPGTTKESILALAENWRPYRTIAAYLLWHDYLCKRKNNAPSQLP